MHNEITQHLLTDAQPVHEQLVPPPWLPPPPILIVLHDVR